MVPCATVTDRLASYAAAKALVMPTVSHLRGWRQNNRVEHSHQPVRQRERGLPRFKSLRHAARFCSVFRTGLQPVSARPPCALGTQLSHGDAPALAGVERRLGDDDVRCRSVSPWPTRLSEVTSLFDALPPNDANNLTTPPIRLAHFVELAHVRVRHAGGSPRLTPHALTRLRILAGPAHHLDGATWRWTRSSAASRRPPSLLRRASTRGGSGWVRSVARSAGAVDVVSCESRFFARQGLRRVNRNRPEYVVRAGLSETFLLHFVPFLRQTPRSLISNNSDKKADHD